MRRPLAAALLTLVLAACGRGGESAPPEGVSGPGAYIALGDSLSEGVGASARGQSDFVSLVVNRLPGAFELLNLGESGDTSFDLSGHGHLQQAVDGIERRREDDDPDNDVKLVTLEIGGNDLLNIYFSRVVTGACPALPDALAKPECVKGLRDALDNFRPIFAGAIEALQEADAEVQLIVMTLYDPFSGGLQTISELADLALEGKEGTPFPEGLNDIIREEAAKSGVTLVDWYPLFEGKAGEYISFDYIHPNDEGYRVMAEAVLDAVR
jgi:lysophospholipase L1-like esterase